MMKSCFKRPFKVLTSLNLELKILHHKAFIICIWTTELICRISHYGCGGLSSLIANIGRIEFISSVFNSFFFFSLLIVMFFLTSVKGHQCILYGKQYFCWVFYQTVDRTDKLTVKNSPKTIALCSLFPCSNFHDSIAELKSVKTLKKNYNLRPLISASEILRNLSVENAKQFRLKEYDHRLS